MSDGSGRYNSASVYVPETGLRAYNEYGEPVGRILMKDTWKVFFEKDQALEQIERSSLFSVGYEIEALVFTDRVAGFVLVDDKYWIEVVELNANGLRLVNWMEYATNNTSSWYANDPGLNVRKGPSSTYDVLATLKGDSFEIIPTKEIKGLWCKVKVTEYNMHPCAGGEAIKTFTGWVKLLSYEFTLNVYNYSRGC